MADDGLDPIQLRRPLKIPHRKSPVPTIYQRRNTSNIFGLLRNDISTKVFIFVNLYIVNFEVKLISRERDQIKLGVGNNSFVSSAATSRPPVMAPASEHGGWLTSCLTPKTMACAARSIPDNGLMHRTATIVDC